MVPSLGYDRLHGLVQEAVESARDEGVTRALLAARLGISWRTLNNALAPSHAGRFSLPVLLRMVEALPPMARRGLVEGMCALWGFAVVEDDDAGLDQAPELVQLAEISQAVGRVAEAVLDSTGALSLGGRETTRRERAAILERVRGLKREVMQLERGLTEAVG